MVDKVRSFFRGFLVTILYNLPLDVFSGVYVLTLDLHEIDEYKRYWMRVAKYNGLASSLALLCLHAAVCESLKTVCSRAPFISRAQRFLLSKCFVLCQASLVRVHVLYAFRFLISSLFHTVVHVVVTHPLPQVSWHESGFWFVTWFYYRWSISGYLLMSLLLLLVVSGFRLLRFAVHHVRVRMTHSAMHLLSVGLLSMHSSNYVVLGLLWTLVLLEYVCFLKLVTLVQVDSLMVYRDDVDSREVVLDIEFINPASFATLYRTGDTVRVYVPLASWFEWHTFSVVPHLHDRTRSRLLVRTVGRWTRRLYRVRKRVAYLWIHGPLALHGDIPSMLVVPHGELPLCIDPGFQMCLVCSGISITRQLSFLVYLVRRYCNIDDDISGVSIGLPAFVKLVWIVRSSFDINLAIRVLDELQACLRTHGWQNVLAYDIYVSHEPNLDERAVNTRLRSFLSSETYHHTHVLPPQPNTNVFVNCPGYAATYANDIQSLLGTPPFGNPPLVASLTHATRSHRPAHATPRANAFSRFYSVLDLKTGQRVRSWLPIVRVEAKMTDRVQWQTLIVLTTGVKRIISDLVELCSNSEHCLELCVEELW